ncbi:CHAT domain-containing tetratricopeptide repeat protein [Streptomyces sp. SID12488]|uniref:CHAT domain-containing protein n=1 Tax=Streptomyces sp. SID12488 TaxID=2706040 RepID=UPI0013DC879A|nr:CHAT domain-containing tetratricopeptide repeat protein [Streptomyces sp. SID12488]NEA68777.1 CHAT domain-containing protein [Streptomyces sp. SID12488]
MDPARLDEVVARQRALSAGPAADPAEVMRLAEALVTRFELAGRPVDLDEAIAAGQRAQQALPADHPYWAEVTGTLRQWRSFRHRQHGTPEDLDEAIALTRLLISARPTGAELPGLLDELSGLLITRYDRAGAITDLDDVLKASRQAVNKTATHDPDWAGRMANLAMALRLHFLRTDEGTDLDLAIHTAEVAVEHLDPGHSGYATVRSNLGILLRARFGRSGDRGDLDRAIRLYRQAVEHDPNDPLARSVLLSNLASALHDRFTHAGNDADLDEAIPLVRRAVDLTPPHDPAKGRHLANLSTVLLSRHDRDGADADLAEALEVLSAIVSLTTAAPKLRLTTALVRAEAAERRGDADAALAALHAAVDLLPVIAWHGLDRASRESALDGVRDVARTTAAVAVRLGRPEHAVEMLEQGTSVLWGQSLRLRTDLSELAVTEPELVDRLHKARQGLDGATADDAERTRLSRLWDATLQEVRGLPGWTDFLAPVPVEQLCRAADEGPVVWLNVAEDRCDALVVTDGRVTVVPLLGLSEDSAVERCNTYLESLSYAAQFRGPEDFLVRERFREELVDMLAWLWDTVTEPVLDALGFTGTPGEPLPRLWWCPTGPLTFLPLHAAGHYGPGADRTRSVPGRVVPSYASGLRALLRARRDRDRAPARVLAVGVAEGDGRQPTLPEVRQEIAGLTAVVPPERLTIRTGPQATRAAVMRALTEHSWLHLAGHTQPDPERPMHTGIVLSDGPLTVLDLADLHLEGAQLAYLSACLTTLGSGRLSDEALHLSAVLQLVGYRHVVATQWHIEDRHAAQMAEAVYSRLSRSGELDADSAARALHDALDELRGRAHPVDWASYVHRGP